MNDQIRVDLEPIIRDTLSKRPEFRLKSVELIPEGHSGFTYFVDVEDAEGPTRYVLRLPPPGARIAGPADVVRQGRIMSALHRAGLPVPAIPVMSSDILIDGRPFILMEAVDGTRIEKAGAENKAIDIATSAVDVLKRKVAQSREQVAADLGTLQQTVRSETQELRRMVTDLRPVGVQSADLTDLMTGFAERFRDEGKFLFI